MSDLLTSDAFVCFAGKAVHGLLGGLADRLDDGPGFVPEGYDFSKWFYPGNERFDRNPAENAGWKLGYAAVDLTPYDYYKHDYYLGGYLTAENGFNNTIESIVDKMMCRMVALDDGSGRGAHIFATVDCIGLGNRHIKSIRRKFADLLKYDGTDAPVASVNVFSTHAHSCVDTQGLWTATGKKVLHNLKKNRTGKGTYLSGTDPDFMRGLTDKIAGGMLAAIKDLTPGTLTYAEKDVGAAYFSNRNRPSATALDTRIRRFIFTPADADKRPTVIANFPAHPDVAGLPTSDGQGSGRELCGEYIYYMDEFIRRAGCNFLFINGAICAIYMRRDASNDGVRFSHRYEQSVRYGRELAKMTLSLSKNVTEIEADPLLADREQTEKDRAESEQNGGGFTLWYENWTPVEETALPPCLNLRLAQIKIPVTNPLIKLVGKLNLASYDVIRAKESYAVCTEIGYLELGNRFRAVLVPGEFCQDLWLGGESLTAEGSYLHRDFPLPPLTETFGKDIHVFGLANDAVGYIVPDNDYVLGEFKNHYHELISLGDRTGSTVVGGLQKLKAEIEA